jgi:transposase-like protein
MRKIKDADLQQAVRAYEENGNCKKKAARAIDVPYATFHNRLVRAGELGMMGTEAVVPGMHIKSISQQLDADGELQKEWIRQTAEHGAVFEMPAGHRAKGYSVFTDAEGHIMHQWIKTAEDPLGVDWTDVFKNAFDGYVDRHTVIAPPKAPDTDYINLIPLNDWHINMLCWWREVGESWDLNIAEKTLGDAIEDVIARTRSAGKAIVLGGGDLMHNDDNSNRTAKSHNVLDADGRHAKGIEVAQRLMVRTIDAALKHNGEVVVRILKGNHDEQSAVAIAHFLKAWYRNEPRVTVDLDQSLFWIYEFGKVMLSATHGHAAKLAKMPEIMSHRQPEMWGRTKFRYAHGFHFHHKEKMATEGGGVIMECHQAPIPQDAWNYGEGFISGRSMQTITYHKDKGERGRVIDVITGEIGKRAA